MRSSTSILLVTILSGSSMRFVADAQERPALAKLVEEAKKEGQLSLYGAFTGGLQATPEGKKIPRPVP